jgi:unsaturated rhamnogalacturonyl hydrolase
MMALAKRKIILKPAQAASSLYAIAKGVRKDYLPATKIAIAKKAYDGILKQFIKEENGQTCFNRNCKSERPWR